MPVPEWTAYLTAAKTALDIFKGIRSELPQGPKADDAQRQIERAEQALKLSEAELAKALGYKLCECTFPPQIMLWNEQEDAHICPRPECGHQIDGPRGPDRGPGSSWVAARRGFRR
jgi:hypothetical protein